MLARNLCQVYFRMNKPLPPSAPSCPPRRNFRIFLFWVHMGETFGWIGESEIAAKVFGAEFWSSRSRFLDNPDFQVARKVNPEWDSGNSDRISGMYFIGIC